MMAHWHLLKMYTSLALDMQAPAAGGASCEKPKKELFM